MSQKLNSVLKNMEIKQSKIQNNVSSESLMPYSTRQTDRSPKQPTESQSSWRSSEYKSRQGRSYRDVGEDKKVGDVNREKWKGEDKENGRKGGSIKYEEMKKSLGFTRHLPE